MKSIARLSQNDVTPREQFERRREFLKLSVGGLAGAAFGLPSFAQAALASVSSARFGLPPSEKLTTREDATHYNNYYEFGLSKEEPAAAAQALRVQPWSLRVEGLVAKPQTFGLDDLLKLAPLEERIYRHRCVEGWSMVLPWVGYPLKALLDKAQPLGSAKFVAFETASQPETMPGLGQRVLDWPYREGLRLDEANHRLTLLALGMYGDVLPKQNGAPVRVVVPWKYGFKSAKSIVRVVLTDKQPATSWNTANSSEYGFYSNVNPSVDHPRWSQAKERRIGEGLLAGKHPTLLFNGYADEVGRLYAGMDLQKFF